MASAVPRLGKVVVKFKSGVIPMGGGGGAGGGEGGGGGVRRRRRPRKVPAYRYEGPWLHSEQSHSLRLLYWQQGMHGQR